MLNLLLTVVSTLVRSVSLIAVLFIVIISYSLIGVTLFNNVRSGEAIDFKYIGISYMYLLCVHTHTQMCTHTVTYTCIYNIYTCTHVY